MDSVSQELEKSLLLFLNHIKNRFTVERDAIESILRKYHWYTVNEETKCSCAAVDSSFLIIESRVGHIYALQGVAVAYELEGSTAKRVASSTFSDTGFIDVKPIKGDYIVKKSLFKKVLTEYAYMLELENIIKVSTEHPCTVVLIDGSFISFAASRRVGGFKAYIESLKGVYSLDDIEDKKVSYLNTLGSQRHVVFLAKSSNAGFYTQGLYSDMYVLELAKFYKFEPYYRAGFLEPMILNVKTVLSKLIKDSKIAIDLFTVTYSRFKDNTPVYQLSLPYKAEVDTIGYVYKCLKKWSASGYPMPLEWTHRLSKLPRKSLINTMMLLGIPIASGRELIDIG